MKKFLLGTAMVLLFSLSHAQFNAGDRYLSGSLTFNNSKSDQPSSYASKQFVIGFSPSYTRFKSDKNASGIKLNSSYSHSKNTSGSNSQITDQWTAGAGVFFQNYFRLGNNFYFFIEKGLNAGYSWSKTEESAFSDNKMKSTGYNASIYVRPGVGYKLTNRFIVNLNFMELAALNYNHSKTETSIGNTPPSTGKSDNVGLSTGLNNAILGSLGITFGWRL